MIKIKYISAGEEYTIVTTKDEVKKQATRLKELGAEITEEHDITEEYVKEKEELLVKHTQVNEAKKYLVDQYAAGKLTANDKAICIAFGLLDFVLAADNITIAPAKKAKKA